MRRCFQVLFGAACLLGFAGSARGQPQPLQHVMGSDCVPRPEGQSGERGCYIIVEDRIGRLPGGPLWWYLEEFPDPRSAQAAKTRHGTVVQAFGRTFLMTVAGADWKPPAGGKLLDRIGPLPMTAGRAEFTATYMEATSMPGRQTPAHTHPGPEAWYMLEGEQCLETPGGVITARAGAPGAYVSGGTPMMLTTVGEGRRRALVLVLHPSDKVWARMGPDWKPRNLCLAKP